DNVDMKERTITIDHSILYRKIDGKFKFYAKEPKTKKGIRVIPMTDDVYECMKELRKERLKRPSTVEVDGYKNFVFTSISGKPLYPINVNKILYRIVREYNETAEEKLPRISNHIFRHTGCTRMGEAEVDLSSMVYIMGHADAKRIQKTYDHVNLKRVRNQMQKLNHKKLDDKEEKTG
ncbi:MAG TPA: tyrosine-type recombinase/integrase, partial [Candidatus Mediterraneibacter caccavium]|nr:tyrosine-type recombinase/integrase [Candidatus Mediterraneibacter caccavium]